MFVFCYLVLYCDYLWGGGWFCIDSFLYSICRCFWVFCRFFSVSYIVLFLLVVCMVCDI